jgi:hypothetical protein
LLPLLDTDKLIMKVGDEFAQKFASMVEKKTMDLRVKELRSEI